MDIATFAAPPDPFLPLVLEEIRTVRGALGLWGVFEIDLEEFLREFLPESPEEEGLTEITSLKYQKRARETLPLIPNTTDLLVRSVVSRGRLLEYELPLEFYRRGADDRYSKHYAEAVINFYFVLEYLFADGKFRTAQVVKNFLATDKLLAGIAEARAQVLQMSRSAEWSEKVRTKYCDPQNEEVINRIVELRGRLHHQSGKRANWHPALQLEFIVDADFIGAVCQSVLMALVLEVLFDRQEKNEFLSVNVYGSNDSKIDWEGKDRLDA